MSSAMNAGRGGSNQRGQSLTEVALGILLIMLLLAGAIEFGRLYLTSMSLQSAAKAAAVYGASFPSDWAGIQIRARGDDLFNLVDWMAVAVTPSVNGLPCAGGELHVDVEYDAALITPFLGTLLGRPTIPVRATAVEPILGPPCP